jgi:hypothetical protein
MKNTRRLKMCAAAIAALCTLGVAAMDTSTARALCGSGEYVFPSQANQYLWTSCFDPVTGIEGYGSGGTRVSGTKYIYVECLSGTCNEENRAVVGAQRSTGQVVMVTTTSTGGSASRMCSDCVKWGLLVGH